MRSVILISVLLGSAAANATTVTINFETDAFGAPIFAPDLINETSALTTLYSPVGVTWDGGGAIINDSSVPGATPSKPNVLVYNADATFSNGDSSRLNDSMYFATGQRSISFEVNGFEGGAFGATAYDSLGQIVDTQNISLVFNYQAVVFVGLDIVRVDYASSFDSGAFGGAMAIDNLQFSTVPVPAAVWLFGSALAGLGWMRRKQTV